ncbi:hypothetical protein TELCIR_07443 [Teladorsagia circumcincta]|uniref:Uncharacterized protein n=1 Tax=Teladorsagia circumcincta TaxID=45464 RepID=A0A2G9UKM1_TELCI|nr:hypothetical protein TELCIR_07443 [Teladorsagia circumcincta]
MVESRDFIRVTTSEKPICKPVSDTVSSESTHEHKLNVKKVVGNRKQRFLKLHDMVNSRKDYVNITILFVVNLLNYVDRYTVAGIAALALLILVVDEPKRGGAEITEGAHLQGEVATSYWMDIKTLATTPTFITCTWAYTALIFVTGTLTWWEPTIIAHSMAWNQGLNDTRLLPSSKKDQVGLIFGLITTVSGIIGVSTGTILSGVSEKSNSESQLVFENIYDRLSEVDEILMFFVITFLCFNWGLNVDMLMVRYKENCL